MAKVILDLKFSTLEKVANANTPIKLLQSPLCVVVSDMFHDMVIDLTNRTNAVIISVE